MSARKPVAWFAILSVCVLFFNADAITPGQFSCPKVCYCQLSGINWATDCSNKHLTAVPHNELDLNTYVLNLDNNLLSELEPFSPSIKMHTLQLSNNLLTEIKTTTFNGLHNVSDVDLSNNLISHVEYSAFDKSNGFVTIDLHGNHLNPVDGPFLFSKDLRNLNLANCSLTDISPKFFVNISNLNTLDLSENPLKKIKRATFKPLRNLKHLILNRCDLTHIFKHAFFRLEALTTLELAQNKFASNVDWTLVLRPLYRLDYLDMSRAGVAPLEIDTFDNKILLRSLVLAGNKLSGLNLAITLGENLINLEFLDLSNCGLKDPLPGNAFSRATKLHTLILSGNRLSSKNLGANLAPLTRLVKLSLRGCGLNNLTTNTFKQLTNLKELDISRNPLIMNNGSLKFLSTLKSLEYLDISYSCLVNISAKTFSKMSNLKTLILSGNKLHSLERGLFQKLSGLQVLEMNNCGLTSLNNIIFFNDFPYYPNLAELRIARNPIRIPNDGSIFPFNMSNLNRLDMSKCNLSYLPENFFMPTPNLKRLLLNDNKFEGERKDMHFIKYLPHIQEIYMSFMKRKDII